jgi:Flp pilus assembly protein TadD
MSLEEQYDDAMFEFSTGNFSTAIAKLREILAIDARHFDAQLALGMAYCRLGDFASAIDEGLKAEQLKPEEQLVHTNLSLFYLKSGDKQKAEQHGLKARISSWKTPQSGTTTDPPENELALAKPPPPPPMKFADQPWKKKPR